MQNKKLIVALDAMGGDYAPFAVIEGAHRALVQQKALDDQTSIEYLIFGDQRC